MNNSTYYYKLTSFEDSLRSFWTGRLDKLNYFEVDLANIDFDLKFFSLINDEMYKACDNQELNEEEDDVE